MLSSPLSMRTTPRASRQLNLLNKVYLLTTIRLSDRYVSANALSRERGEEEKTTFKIVQIEKCQLYTNCVSRHCVCVYVCVCARACVRVVSCIIRK